MPHTNSDSIPSPRVHETQPTPEAAQDRAITPLQGEDDHPVPYHLQQLISNTSISAEVLESAVDIGKRLIHSLTMPLMEAASNYETVTWLKRLKELQARSETLRTVVGVVGNTGAGKSSVINALLSEER